jgi:hypothetical protein
MIGSGLSSPPDDGTCRKLLDELKVNDEGRLVWDDEGMIRGQYERKMRPMTFGFEWLQELLVRNKIVSVPRAVLEKACKRKILDTGLVGEDLNYYVRTAAASPDRRLVSHDKHYDAATCGALKKELEVFVLDATEGHDFLVAESTG